MIHTTLHRLISLILCLYIIGVSGTGCYSFKGISIDPNLKTFTVRTLETSALNAPANLAVGFTEALKDKIRTETPLQFNDESPDCEFSGSVTDFRVQAIAPKPGETVALNQLTIAVRIQYTINKEGIKTNYPESGQSFSFFADFGADQDLLSVQDRLIEEIQRQLLENIFNAVFNDW
jgi:Lipopolysaccharide-assembly